MPTDKKQNFIFRILGGIKGLIVTLILAPFRYFLSSRFLIGALTLILILIAGAALIKGAFFGSKNPSPVVSANSNQKVQLPPAKSTKTVNKEFAFPVNDSAGKTIGNIKYIIETAELRDGIIVKGQKATSVAGRTFLIFNLKLVNEVSKGVELKTRDFVRLSSNNGTEWLAPDIHNDPVELQAISTKYTRVGYAVNESDKNYKIQVGEINGTKQNFDLNF